MLYSLRMLSRPVRAPALRRAIECRRAFATRYPPAPRASRNPQRKSNSSGRAERTYTLEQNTAKNLRQDASIQKSLIQPKPLEESNLNQNTLLSPVHIPEDPNAILKEDHPAAKLLTNSGLVIQRRLEMMNVFLGFEQANRYVIMDAQGNCVGYIAERDNGIGNAMARQMFRTHRSFTAHVFDRDEVEILRIHRPFSWINSYIRVYDPLNNVKQTYLPPTSDQLASTTAMVEGGDRSNVKISQLPLSEMRVIGEVQQQWAPLRRKYNLFLNHQNPTAETDMGSQQTYHQFAYVNELLLSWDFTLRSADDRLIGSVNRNFAGFAREIFTDTGVYALRMDSAALPEEKELRHPATETSKEITTPTENVLGMTLDQRAVMLATAVSIDFDYFSRHSSAHDTTLIPWMIPGQSSVGGAAAGTETAAGAGAAAESTALGEVGASAAGRTAGAAGTIAEGTAAGAAGAGTMAGYEAMQRGLHERNQSPYPSQDSTPTPAHPEYSDAPEEVWGEAPPDHWGPKSGDGPGRGEAPGGGAGDGSTGNSDGSIIDEFLDLF